MKHQNGSNCHTQFFDILFSLYRFQFAMLAAQNVTHHNLFSLLKSKLINLI